MGGTFVWFANSKGIYLAAEEAGQSPVYEIVFSSGGDRGGFHLLSKRWPISTMISRLRAMEHAGIHTDGAGTSNEIYKAISGLEQSVRSKPATPRLPVRALLRRV